MNREETLHWIAELFQEPPGTLTEETPRTAIASWDSLGVLTLMAALDEKFDLVVTDESMSAMQKVGDVLELLTRSGKLK